MSALWAIIVDTWRQSRQQVVFIIMLVVLALLAVVPAVIAAPEQREGDDGQSVEVIGVLGMEGSAEALAANWGVLYGQSVVLERGIDSLDGGDGLEIFEEFEKIAELQATTPMKQRGVEVLLYYASRLIFSVSMLLFIIASSGYFPLMLESGAIDIVLAKPLPRWKVLIGKYLGGLALFSVALIGTYIVLVVGLGLRTGVWHPAVFWLLPAQLLIAATLFALIALLGLVSRSTTLCVVLGLTYYFLVDTVISGLVMAEFAVDWARILSRVLEFMPNFGRIKDMATLAVIRRPAPDLELVGVTVAWLVLTLVLSWWKFERTDY